MLAHTAGVEPLAVATKLFVFKIDPNLMRPRVRQKQLRNLP